MLFQTVCLMFISKVITAKKNSAAVLHSKLTIVVHTRSMPILQQLPVSLLAYRLVSGPVFLCDVLFKCLCDSLCTVRVPVRILFLFNSNYTSIIQRLEALTMLRPKEAI